MLPAPHMLGRSVPAMYQRMLTLSPSCLKYPSWSATANCADICGSRTSHASTSVTSGFWASTSAAAPSTRRAAMRTITTRMSELLSAFIGSPRTAGPQPRVVLRLALPVHWLASDGGAPAPRRPAARTTRSLARLGRRGPSPAPYCGSQYPFIRSPPAAGPQPRVVLRLALPVHWLASDGGAPAPRRPAARTTRSLARLGRRGPSPASSCGSHYPFIGSPRTAGPQPRVVLRLALPVHWLAS